MQYSKFAVGEIPYCVWEWDLHERNLNFINSIDPTYFEYIAKIHGQSLSGEDSKHAAIALRMAYTHGLETFFALLCATIQAPDCVVGWILKYRELHSLVEKIQKYQPIPSKLKIKPVSWDNISTAVHLFSLEDQAKEKIIKENFAKLWRGFASDYLNEKSQKEYNSIKHGLRVKVGGFQLAVGLQDKPGAIPPPPRMHSLGGSEFGSTFFVPEKIGDEKSHFRVRRHSRNWNPENFAHSLNLISLSINNILSFLKLVNGVDSDMVQFLWPDDEAYFQKPWKRVGGVSEYNMDIIIGSEHIIPFDKNEIMDEYITGDS